MQTIDELRHTTTVPVIIADHHGVILHVNERFTEAFGWQPADILGKPLTIIIPRTLHDAHQLGFSRFLASGRPTLLNQPLRLHTVAKDGRILETEHVIIAEQQQGQWVFAATIRPLDSATRRLSS
jgi:PAS domain S-box-containing protein